MSTKHLSPPGGGIERIGAGAGVPPAASPREGASQAGLFWLLLVSVALSACGFVLGLWVIVEGAGADKASGWVVLILAIVAALTAGFAAGYLVARTVRTKREAGNWEKMERLIANVERALEGVAAAEELQYKAAQRMMPSARELDAVAGKLPFPRGWYEEEHDPF